MKMIITIVGLLIYFTSSALLAAIDYDIDSLPDDGTRELVTARQAFQEHYLRKIEMIVHIQTPGFVWKEVTNTRYYNQEKKRHTVGFETTRVWLEGAPFETERELDFCLQANNKGFFTVQLHNNIIGYTRDGRFRIDFQNRLVTLNGYYPVLGKNGFIEVDPMAEINVSRAGSVVNDGKVIDQLDIKVFRYSKDLNHLYSFNGAFFSLSKDVDFLEGTEHYAVLQGFITQSNSLNSVRADHWYYSNSHNAVIHAYDRIMESKKTFYNTALSP